jgi:hypothetical protein
MTISRSSIWGGVRIYVSDHMTIEQQTQVKRSWWERLFALPWRPRERFKTITTRVPNPQLMRLNVNGEDAFIAHPATFARLRQQLKARGVPDAIESQVLPN